MASCHYPHVLTKGQLRTKKEIQKSNSSQMLITKVRIRSWVTTAEPKPIVFLPLKKKKNKEMKKNDHSFHKRCVKSI